MVEGMDEQMVGWMDEWDEGLMGWMHGSMNGQSRGMDRLMVT